MIFASHLVVYSRDVDADRAVLRDVFGWESVDAGDGWLIFALPPAEAAIHPADQSSMALYLMSTDLDSDVRALESSGVRFAAVETAGWGSVTTFTLPGGCRVGLYQPSHPSLITPPQ